MHMAEKAMISGSTDPPRSMVKRNPLSSCLSKLNDVKSWWIQADLRGRPPCPPLILNISLAPYEERVDRSPLAYNKVRPSLVPIFSICHGSALSRLLWSCPKFEAVGSHRHELSLILVINIVGCGALSAVDVHVFCRDALSPKKIH